MFPSFKYLLQFYDCVSLPIVCHSFKYFLEFQLYVTISNVCCSTCFIAQIIRIQRNIQSTFCFCFAVIPKWKVFYTTVSSTFHSLNVFSMHSSVLSNIPQRFKYTPVSVLYHRSHKTFLFQVYSGLNACPCCCFPQYL